MSDPSHHGTASHASLLAQEARTANHHPYGTSALLHLPRAPGRVLDRWIVRRDRPELPAATSRYNGVGGGTSRVLTMGGTPLDLNQSPTNINFNFNVSFDGRWMPNGHLTVRFSVRWVNALASAVASVTPSDATTTHSSRPSTSIQVQCCLRTLW